MKPARPRIESVDLLRGIVMVLMALDHARIYFTNFPFQPENMEHTWLGLFLTRWVTHFCAPVFFLLAGTGSALAVLRGKPVSEVSRFLWTRGLWLVALELTVIGFSWSFVPGFRFGGVIWALGWCMVLMAGLIRLDVRVIGAAGIIVMVFHHLIPAGETSWIRTVVYGPGMIGEEFFVLYPLVPSIGVMAAGYALGFLFSRGGEERTRWLLWAGVLMTACYVLLRASNLYGHNDGPLGLFSMQESLVKTLILFLNTEKYPFSLQFLLMTLGPSLLFLAAAERFSLPRWIRRPLLVFGRVPLFYYVLHIPLIHSMAIVVAWVTGQPADGLIGPLPFVSPGTEEYGHSLGFAWLMTVTAVTLLYFPCRWFEKKKKAGTSIFWSYL